MPDAQLLPKLIDAYNKQYPSTPLRRIRLHDLRHIHATTLLLAGVPVHMVAARLGHADPSVTLRGYAHVIQELTPAVIATSLEVASTNSLGPSTRVSQDVVELILPKPVTRCDRT